MNISESQRADERLTDIEKWANLYYQTTEHLTAYRVYKYEKNETFTLYIQDETDKLMIVSDSFDDDKIKGIVDVWCA